jgi:uncharacterized protein
MKPKLSSPLSRRRLLQTSAQLAVMAPFFRSSTALWANESAATKRILFFTRSQTFEHSVIKREGDAPSHAGRVLREFGGAAGFEFHETKDGGVFDGDLDQYDAFFFYTTGDLTKTGGDNQPPMTAAGKQRLLDAIAKGKGMFGSHCASDTFHSEGPAFENQDQPDPFIQMLGGEFIRHGRQQEARMKVVSPGFPGLRPAGDGFTLHEEWYSLKNFAPDMHVILVQETQGMDGRDYERPDFPATWARMEDQGRVFYTSMGHREDVWTHPIFQSIVVGGLQWVTGQVEAEISPNLDLVAPHARRLPRQG